MAKALNRTRIRDTWLIALFVMVIYCLSRGVYPDEGTPHEIMEFIGYLLVIVCAFGRIYCSAYIAGKKNAELITAGPFSIVRNPLYVFSFIGIVGIGLMSSRLSVLLAFFVLFPLMLHFLVKREEAFLREAFGEAYTSYCATVPRFFPKFSLFQTPEEIIIKPKRLLRAIVDSTFWFLPLPFFELVEALHEAHVLPQVMTVF